MDANGDALPRTTVLLTQGKAGRTADAQGNYIFENVCYGRYAIKVQYIGYEGVSLKIEISGEAKRDFQLQEKATELDEVVVQHHDAEIRNTPRTLRK